MQNRVIVVGAGLAGMVAALGAREKGAEVTLVDRGSVGLGTNSALSGGLFTGPTKLHGLGEYTRETLHAGRGINCEDMVKLIGAKASVGFDFLRSLDLQIAELPTAWAVRPSNPEIIPGLALVRKVAEKMRELRGIFCYTGFYVTHILTNNGQACGVRGFDRTGKDRVIYGDGVVLAAGGAGAIYSRHDNQRTIMGQGYYLAARAGLTLWDMEFVQCYPLVIAEPHLPSMLVYPPHAPEARLVNGRGEDILARYGIQDINEAIMKKRDQLSLILHEESRTTPVLLDLSNVPKQRWASYPLAVLGKLQSEAIRKPFAVSPAVHFCMGGIAVDHEGQTGLPGLYACGEITWGMHGANRRGGNALTECVVMGRIAGGSAAMNGAREKRNTGQPHDKDREGKVSSGQPGPPVSLRELRDRIRCLAWECAGVVRDEESMRKGLRALDAIAGEARKASWAIVRERVIREDLMSAVFSLRAILSASLGRKESRGSFIRRDFPKEDNAHWRKNSCLTYNPEKSTFSVTYHSVK